MSIDGDIADYLAGQPEPKRSELGRLHEFMVRTFPDGDLWFDDGLNDDGKVVSNPSIGYGSYTIRYADGATKEFYRVGLSGNSTGISVYVLGLEDKSTLRESFGHKIGKATITGYCIKFRRTADINMDSLQEAMRFGMLREGDG